MYFCYQENVDIDLHIFGTEGFEKNILDYVTPLRDLITQGHANDNVTCDLQTKAFQGHYFSHKKLVELRNISLIDTVNFVWYDYRDYIVNNIKSLPHTGDLQSKAVQGHYLKHKEIVELQNISLTDTVNFVWYDYNDCMVNNINSLPHTGDLQTKTLQGH